MSKYLGSMPIRNWQNGFCWFFAIVSSVFVSQSALAAYTLNMTPGVTALSHKIYDLHMTIFYICCVIGVFTFGALIYSLIHYRRSKGAVAAKFHEHTLVEVVWAVIPFIILIVMAVPATKVLFEIHDSANAVVNIKVTGYQWKWQYEYLGEDIKFFSNLATPYNQIQNKEAKNPWYLLEVDKPVVVPTHEKIRFIITSNNVIHAWWVPALGIKQDAIPGYANEAWAIIEKPGEYRGQCAELCGANHGFMPIVVRAVPRIEYDAWVASQKAPTTPATGSAATAAAPAVKYAPVSHEELMKTGQTEYEKYCIACHKADGSGTPPVFPALKGSAIATGPLSVHLDRVLNGKNGTAMQAFGLQLDDATLAAIITYERNAWGNSGMTQDGKTVQASDVKAQREKVKK
jgi:cytochrome c oxidase subunit 2